MSRDFSPAGCAAPPPAPRSQDSQRHEDPVAGLEVHLLAQLVAGLAAQVSGRSTSSNRTSSQPGRAAAPASHSAIQRPSIYDDTVNLTTYDYDDPNNHYLVTRRTAPNEAQTNWTYNEKGLVTSVEDAQGNVTTFQHADDLDDPLNPKHRNLLRKIFRPEVTVDGVPTIYNPTVFEYDPNGNLKKVFDSTGEYVEFTVRSDGLVEAITDRRNKTTLFSYYSNGNLETVTSPESRTLTFDYDDYDNLTEVTDDLGQTVTSDYDEVDRVIQMTDARGHYVTLNYVDGLLDSLEAPPNQGSGVDRRSVSYTYGEHAPHLLEVHADVSSMAQQLRVRYEYSGFSRLKKLIREVDSVPRETSYRYDRLGRVRWVNDPLNRETEFEPEPYCVGTVVTTARGVERAYSYDSLCRLTLVETPRERQIFEYDEWGRLVRATTGSKYGTANLGENATMAVELYLYDELNRLKQVTYPNGEVAGYDYDKEGNVIEVTDVHGNVTAYTYYDDNRLHEVKIQRAEEADRVFTYLYDEVGRLDEIQYPEETDIVLRFYEMVEDEKVSGWDENGQLLFMQYLKDDEHLQSFRYAYDDSGNRTQMVDTPASPGTSTTWDYAYDWLNRLVGVARDSVATTAYAYDEADNRIEANLLLLDELHTFEYDAADQLESHSVAEGEDPPAIFETFEHDADGNMISRTRGGEVTEYRWTDFDQMARRVVDGDYQEGHAYDAGNQRRFRTGKTRYYDSLAELRPSGEVSFFQGHQLLGMEHAGERFYYLTDGLASVRLMVDEDGEVVASFSHDEWGVQESPPADAALSTHTYVGALNVRNENAASGLLLMGHRWYDSSLGRFLTRDPIGFEGGLNLYGYAGSNPTNFLDPFGLQDAPAPYGPYPTGIPVRTVKGNDLLHLFDGAKEGIFLTQSMLKGEEAKYRTKYGADFFESVADGEIGPTIRWRNCFSYAAQELGILKAVGKIKNFWLNSNLFQTALKDAKDAGLIQDVTKLIGKGKPQAGDLVIYANKAGWQHAGIVEADGRVRSDWGNAGLCRHKLGSVPPEYGKPILYFRSN